MSLVTMQCEAAGEPSWRCREVWDQSMIGCGPNRSNSVRVVRSWYRFAVRVPMQGNKRWIIQTSCVNGSRTDL